VIEDGVYCFGLSDYPHITKWELKNLLAFIEYERSHGRRTQIVCEDAAILAAVDAAVTCTEKVAETPLPEKIMGCVSCNHRGCLTQFICHATDVECARQILSGGKLFSAVKVSGKTGEQLSFEKRDSQWNDPADFFEYIMFCWGNCVVGDYVVMSDGLGRAPNEEDFEKDFNAAVRFYFRYEDVIRHPGHVLDGYHPVKVKDEILLRDYLHACVVPEQFKFELKNAVLPKLAAKVYYLSQDGLGVRDWTEKVYDFVSKI